MRRIVSVLVAHPASCLAVVLAITVAFATQIPGLKVNVSPRMLMVGSDPAVAYYEGAMERFGTDEITIIVVKADDVFTTGVLESIDRLSNAAREIAEVTKVDSLTTVDDIRGEADWVSTKPLVPGAIPKEPAALDKIRTSALRNPVMVGNDVAHDARTAAVVIYSAGDPNDPKFNARFANEIDAIIDAEHGRSGLEMYQIGKPYRQAMLAKSLIEDQEIIWPLAMLIITIVVVFMLRAPMAVLILMVARLTCVVWAVGMMGLFDFPVTMLSSLIPLLLKSVGFTEDVYLVAEF
jgi:predicted RND superfamily exporter protein